MLLMAKVLCVRCNQLFDKWHRSHGCEMSGSYQSTGGLFTSGEGKVNITLPPSLRVGPSMQIPVCKLILCQDLIG